ncbi:MAG TPA: hypothetical protein VFP41_03105 [Actinomycetota bacterium]|nr:hypothetical protein [Actinomycetota bacterium]
MQSAVARSLVTAMSALVVLTGVGTSAVAAPGKLDTMFSGDGHATAFPKGATGYAVAIDAKGRIVVAGYTLSANTRIAVARFRPNGTLDPNFGEGDGRVATDLGGTDYAFDVAIGPSGRILVAGTRERRSGSRMAVAALTRRGALNRSFSSDGVAYVSFGKRFQSANALTITGAGKIVLGGSTSNGSTSRWALARLNPDGSRDRSFGGDGRVTLDLSRSGEQINDLTPVPGGKIVAVGSVESGLSPRIAIARLSPGGAPDRTFGKRGVKLTNVGNGADTAYGVTRQPDGKLVVVGHVANGGKADWGVLCYGANGRLDPTFHGDGIRILRFGPDYEFAQASAVQSNARIVVVGRIRRSNNDQFGVVRLKANGSYDLSFSTDGRLAVDFDGGSDTARDVVLQANGKIVVVGEATVGGTRRVAVARLRAS